MNKIILKIEGMTCSACSNGLEKYLNFLETIGFKQIKDMTYKLNTLESYAYHDSKYYIHIIVAPYSKSPKTMAVHFNYEALN